MGQDISFQALESGRNSTHIYSLNRSLTGMEIISYSDPEFDVDINSGADVLAKSLLGLGVDSVSIYSNVVTISCDYDRFQNLKQKIEDSLLNLFRFYGENANWEPTLFDRPV